MAENKSCVSMRVRIGECELEVSGPKAFVEKNIEEFLAKQRDYAPNPKKPTKPPIAPAKPAGTMPDKKTSAAQFFRKAAPKTDVDRALLAGYFLEKYQNGESFTSIEIRETIRSAKIAPPKNPSDAIAKNIKKGLMMSAGDKDGKMAFVLTSDGEDAVDDAANQN